MIRKRVFSKGAACGNAWLSSVLVLSLSVSFDEEETKLCNRGEAHDGCDDCVVCDGARGLTPLLRTRDDYGKAGLFSVERLKMDLPSVIVVCEHSEVPALLMGLTVGRPSTLFIVRNTAWSQTLSRPRPPAAAAAWARSGSQP